MSDFSKMVEAVLAGGHPLMVVESACGPMGADRNDDIDNDAARVAAFSQIAGQIQDYKGYVGPDWVTNIADQLRGADPNGIADLTMMAQQNREQYTGTARIDAGGSWQMWDNIYRGLLALRTEQMPPPTPPLS